ncbi:MAG TPA: DUF4870 domain-containing protein [Thermoanaerobaculia bacterium]|nr:DUF4870 domain-containing protein [Thermoanaerobaculia bacterium]
MSEIPPPTVPPAVPPPPGGGSYTPPPPPPPGGPYGGAPAGGGGDRTLMVVLSYLWILALIPLLTKKEDSEVQWHAKNGIGILIGEIVAWIVFFILGMVLPDIGGCGVSVISCVVWIAFLVIRIICIVQGVGGKRFSVPVLTDLGQKINF